MNSKSVALFLALGLAASVTACGGADVGGEGGEASEIAPTTLEEGESGDITEDGDIMEGEEGGEGGDIMEGGEGGEG